MKRFMCLAGLLVSPAVFSADDLQNCRLAGSRLEKSAPELRHEFLPNNLPTNTVKAKKGGQLFSWESYKVLAPVVSVTTPISINDRLMFVPYVLTLAAPGNYQVDIMTSGGKPYYSFRVRLPSGNARVFFTPEAKLCDQFVYEQNDIGWQLIRSLTAPLNVSIEKEQIAVKNEGGSLNFMGAQDGMVGLELRTTINGEIKERKSLTFDQEASLNKEINAGSFAIKIRSVENDILQADFIKR